VTRSDPAPPSAGSRALLVALYEAAVAAAAPGPLTTAALRELELEPEAPVRLFALGKAAHRMAAGALDFLDGAGRAVAGGVIVAPDAAPPPHPSIAVLAGDHPLPGERSFAAAEAIGRAAAAVRPGDVALVLLSGGTSSLIAAPIGGVTRHDLAALFSLLAGSGLDIHAMNVVRKRFTRWGAGRLAVGLEPVDVHVLAISDVPGDEPADIGSGPCAPDPCTAADVLALLRDARLHERLAPAMREHLDAASRAARSETPKPGDPAFARVRTRIVGSNALAVEAAVSRARALGLNAHAAARPLDGDAAARGAEIAEALLERARRGECGCVVWGGETTVALGGTAVDASMPAGPGGRCQELALSAARALAAAGSVARRVAILAAGTDGRDGPTDAAGAFADAAVWRAAERAGRDPALALARHESYAALDAAGALYRRGLTGTNVMDVVIGVVE
jgi:hydroxypyruvate reductase